MITTAAKNYNSLKDHIIEEILSISNEIKDIINEDDIIELKKLSIADLILFKKDMINKYRNTSKYLKRL